jgi:hypothetical protein
MGLSDSGSLTPGLAGETITIVYTPTVGSPVTHAATTADGGSYSDSVRLAPGQWVIQAHWAGDGSYLPADSSSCSLTIGK